MTVFFGIALAVAVALALVFVIKATLGGDREI